MKLQRLAPITVVVAALIAMVAFTGSVGAQDATPSTTVDMSAAHPAHIHDGSCPEPGGIAYPLNDVSAPGSEVTMMGTPVAMTTATPTMVAMASPMAGMTVVAESTTTVSVALSDLEAEPYAVNLHESLANIGNYIACGDITGTATGGSLTVQLTEENSSGLTGTAVLKDNGDGTTTVTIQLMESTS